MFVREIKCRHNVEVDCAKHYSSRTEIAGWEKRRAQLSSWKIWGRERERENNLSLSMHDGGWARDWRGGGGRCPDILHSTYIAVLCVQHPRMPTRIYHRVARWPPRADEEGVAGAQGSILAKVPSCTLSRAGQSKSQFMLVWKKNKKNMLCVFFFLHYYSLPERVERKRRDVLEV